MKNISWPKPPMHNKNTPPKIPDCVCIFGLMYRCIDGNPVADVESVVLDKKTIRGLLKESMSSFIKLLKTNDPVYLNRINEVHSKLNEIYNKAMDHEKKNALQEEKEKMKKKKLELYENIKRLINY